jgi:hypothetical protein
VALAFATIIFLAPMSLWVHATLPSTPLLHKRIAFGSGVFMSIFGILTTFLGYDVMDKVIAATKEGTGDAMLFSVGIAMASIASEFFDEAAVIALSTALAYFADYWENLTGRPSKFFRFELRETATVSIREIFGMDTPGTGGARSSSSPSGRGSAPTPSSGGIPPMGGGNGQAPRPRN